MAMYAEVERFLAEHIGGRYQESMPDDVAARLKELQVDISTVTYEPAEEVATSEALPTIADRFAEGSFKYTVNIEVQGQNIPMSTTRTVAKDGDHWVVTDESRSPQGKMVDAVTYGADLNPLSRLVQQGGQDIEMVYTADKVNIAMGENKMEIPYDGALFTSGAGMETVLSGMPLKVGYEIVVMVPDLASMSAKQSKIEVAEIETVDGVDYFRVNITGVENENNRTTVWINAGDHSVLKMEQVVPAMQNAVITTTKAG
jgi:hypothetical protein